MGNAASSGHRARRIQVTQRTSVQIRISHTATTHNFDHGMLTSHRPSLSVSRVTCLGCMKQPTPDWLEMESSEELPEYKVSVGKLRPGSISFY